VVDAFKVVVIIESSLVVGVAVIDVEFSIIVRVVGTSLVDI
jgi:hypothetical protein